MPPGIILRAMLPAGTSWQLGSEVFGSVGTTLSWTITFNSTELAALNSFLADGKFDLGFDPDCHYNVGSISFHLHHDAGEHAGHGHDGLCVGPGATRPGSDPPQTGDGAEVSMNKFKTDNASCRFFYAGIPNQTGFTSGEFESSF